MECRHNFIDKVASVDRVFVFVNGENYEDITINYHKDVCYLNYEYFMETWTSLS